MFKEGEGGRREEEENRENKMPATFSRHYDRTFLSYHLHMSRVDAKFMSGYVWARILKKHT